MDLNYFNDCRNIWSNTLKRHLRCWNVETKELLLGMVLCYDVL